MNLNRSDALMDRARHVVAAGVNSNVRLLSVPRPLMFSHGSGARITDVDGNTYIDYVLGQGPLIHGHGHPELLAAATEWMQRGMMFAGQHEGEIALAETLCELVPCAELVRLASTGTEALQAAIRLARAFTGRNRLLKFEGHYHGWLDNVFASFAPPLDKAGPREAPHTVPVSPGQDPAAVADMIVLPWNDAEVLEQTLRAHGHEIAAVLTEPIMGNAGCILPKPGYLEKLRALCDEYGILLIFDEIITGFRVAPGGAQERLGVTPDLATFGKALAGGFPVSCLAGRRDVMSLLGSGVTHSGTYNASLLVVGATLKCLELLTRDDGAAYRHLFRLGERLREGIAGIAREQGLTVQIQGVGPMFHVSFCDEPLTDYRSTLRMDTSRYHRLCVELLRRGVRVLERGMWYVSTAHTDADIDETLHAFADAARALEAPPELL